jgi:glycerophosphoryl diester phosphodiesterase
MKKVLSMAHRGFSAAAPENTMSAYRMAMEYGPDFIECDVRLSKEGEVIIMHDAALARTTNSDAVLADLTVPEIKKIDAGSWFGPRFAGEQIPLLTELLNLAKDKVPLLIELKEEGEIEKKVADMVRSRNMTDQVYMISFHYEIGPRLKEYAPEIKFGPIKSIREPVLGRDAIETVKEIEAVNGKLFCARKDGTTPDLVKACHDAGILIEPWTTDDADEMRKFIEMGVDGITSNKIDLLEKVIKEYK